MAITKGSLVQFNHRKGQETHGLGLCVSQPVMEVVNTNGPWKEWSHIPPRQRVYDHFYAPKSGKEMRGSRSTIKVYWQKSKKTTTEITMFLMRVTKKGQRSALRAAERRSKGVDPCHACGEKRIRVRLDGRARWTCDCPGRRP